MTYAYLTGKPPDRILVSGLGLMSKDTNKERFHMEYWIVWGYTPVIGLWAALDSREQAEERQRAWKCQNPGIKVSIYHQRGLCDAS